MSSSLQLAMLQVFLVAFTKQMYLINRQTQGAFQRWDSWGSIGTAQLVWAGSQGTGLLALLRPALAITRAASPPFHLHLRERAWARAQPLLCTPTLTEEGGA